MSTEDLLASFSDSMMIPSDNVRVFLRKYEREHFLSQKEMAEKVGMSQQNYHNLGKSRRMRGFVVRRISESLNVPLSDILADRRKEIEIILESYPAEVLEWLSSPVGIEVILKEYESHLKKQSEISIDLQIRKLSKTFDQLKRTK